MKYAVIRSKTLLLGIFLPTLVILGGLGLYASGIFSPSPESIPAAASMKKLPIYWVDTKEKKAALTVNCAWDDAQLEDWLALLKKYEAPSTFFAVGDWCSRYPDAVKKIHEAGHELGTHSDTHPDMTKLSNTDIRRELQDSAQKVERITGKCPLLFRAPSGAYNDAVITTAEKLGFTPIQWNIDSVDWKGPSPAQIEKRVLGSLKPGSILLFHLGKQNALEALEPILKSAKEQGYTFVPVSSLIYKEDYHLNAAGKQIPNASPDSSAAE